MGFHLCLDNSSRRPRSCIYARASGCSRFWCQVVGRTGQRALPWSRVGISRPLILPRSPLCTPRLGRQGALSQVQRALQLQGLYNALLCSANQTGPALCTFRLADRRGRPNFNVFDELVSALTECSKTERIRCQPNGPRPSEFV